jgi:ABC-type transport system involved in multi-copper enzyme maturation permease subunit
MPYRLFVKELRYTLKSILLWLMAGYVVIDTYFKGIEFLGNARTSVVFASLAEEWGYRASCFPLYLYMLIAAVLIYYCFNRDERYGVRSLVFTKEISTHEIVLSRTLGIGVALCVAYTVGVLVGISILGMMNGYYPTPSALFYGLCLNAFPALFAWSTTVVCLSIRLGDLKVLVFPVVLVWFLGQVFPGVSLILSHTELAVIFCSDSFVNPIFLWHVIKILGVSMLLFWLGVDFLNCQLLGLDFQGPKGDRKRLNEEASKKVHELISNLWLARTVYDFKVALGAKLIGGVVGSIALPFLIFGPFSPASRISSSGNTYFAIAFSELFLPLIGLLVSSGTLDLEDRIGLLDVVVAMPGGKRGLLRQKLATIVSYFAAVLVVYVITLKVLVPHISMLSTGLILGASMMFVSVLAMCISWLSGHPLVGYGISGIIVVSGLLMEEQFPWFISPVYILAEYTTKVGVDRLILNKVLLVLYSIAGLALVMYKFCRGRTRRGEAC